MNCDKVLYYFEKINEIPRGSGNEKAVSDYTVKFAEERGLWVKQDKFNNVIIKKPASKGYENAEPVVIQGHLDMVCEKNPDVVHDFENDPIKVIYDGDFIHADGTTLGADDGIAVAMALALLEDNNAEHPALEILFTTDEEVGMLGAGNLDAGDIKGRKLINIDSEEEGIFTVGCAGGRKTNTVISIEYIAPPCSDFAMISVSGLLGGHSGIDINKKRANANVVMNEVVERLVSRGCYICSVNGGAKDNAIPRDSVSVICCKDFLTLKSEFNDMAEVIKAKYIANDPGIEIKIEKCGKYDKVFSSNTSKNLIGTIKEIPNGVITMDSAVNMVRTSNNIGVVRTDEKEISVVCAVRSALTDEKLAVYNEIAGIGEKYNGKTTYRGDYPSWEYKENSPLRELFSEVYEELFDSRAKIETVHAGLECGLLSEKLPDADMISFGPNLLDIHTPKERASISSVERMCRLLTEVLKKMK